MISGRTRGQHKALDRFEVMGELGQGAASRILHIRDPESLQHYALKIVIRRTAEEQKFLDQAKHEYEVAQRFDHPALLKIFDIRVIRRWFREREVRTLLEYVNGKSLEQIEKPPAELLVLVFAEAASAMSHMHQRGVFHADLKPNNILVSQSGQVKVIDFGLAWLRGSNKNRVQGTMGYLAPEQLRDRVVTEATDIYNFGASMYRMFTGRTASGAGSDVNILPKRGIIIHTEELRPDLPQSLASVIDRCCETKPHKRPQSMYEVGQILNAVAAELKVSNDLLPQLLRRRGDSPS